MLQCGTLHVGSISLIAISNPANRYTLFFQVSAPTPTKDNDCPRPPKELVINEVGGVLGANIFVELTGPRWSPLQGLVIVLHELSTARHVVPLEGSLTNDGFFLIGNGSKASEYIRLCGSGDK